MREASRLTLLERFLPAQRHLLIDANVLLPEYERPQDQQGETADPCHRTQRVGPVPLFTDDLPVRRWCLSRPCHDLVVEREPREPRQQAHREQPHCPTKRES